MKTQVKEEHYHEGYDDAPRFISYYYQTNSVRKLGPKKVLEIGIGNKMFSNYMRQAGYKVTTCDYDKTLKPDYVADIRKLPFKDRSFDVVTAFEILEHLPFDEAKKALKELKRVSSKYVVISIPCVSVYGEFVFKLPLMKKFFGRDFIKLFIGIPAFFLKLKENNQHFWEMGRQGYPKRKIRKWLQEDFKIKEELRVPLNAFHYFFVLEKN